MRVKENQVKKWNGERDTAVRLLTVGLVRAILETAIVDVVAAQPLRDAEAVLGALELVAAGRLAHFSPHGAEADGADRLVGRDKTDSHHMVLGGELRPVERQLLAAQLERGALVAAPDAHHGRWAAAILRVALHGERLEVEQDLEARTHAQVPVARATRQPPLRPLVIVRPVGARDHPELLAAHIAAAV